MENTFIRTVPMVNAFNRRVSVALSAGPGELLEEDEQKRIDALIEDVEQSRPLGSERPLENPLIFGNYQVAYVSTRKAPRQEGQRELLKLARCITSIMHAAHAGC